MMKQISNWVFSMVCFLLATTMVSSCDLHTPDDPEYPLYVTYTISAGEASFNGPEQLLIDIKSWIDNNQIVYDQKVNYSTGAVEEFTTTDAEAAKKYEDEFLPKFKAYLDQVKSKLANGTYGENVTVDATFYVFASRTQGDGGNIKYDTIKLVYPSSSAQ